MYDMLGNVWEWVRDDWSNSISGFNGSVNPIAGSTLESSAEKKVIRGGAFDQFCRKVISSAREGLEKGECKSENAT